MTTLGVRIVISLVAFTMLHHSDVFTQFIQQGNKLVGTGGGGSLQGAAVSISADGNTAIVSGYADSSFRGAAWVFTRSNGVWSQQGGKLVSNDGVGASEMGYYAAISADGNTAILGGYQDSFFVGEAAGAAWVFARSGGVWTQQGSKLVGTGASGFAKQGTAVSLSADGNTAIVGGYRDSNNIGAVWIYSRSGGVWTQQGSKLVGTGSVGLSFQGLSAALSGDGNTAIVGGPSDNAGVGAAWVFIRSGGEWTQQGNKLVAVGGANQAAEVAISSDGNTAILGGPRDSNNTGAAWVFTRSGGVWTQQGGKLVGKGAVGSANQGSVSLSSDGNTAIVGGPGDSSSTGAAWVFTRRNGLWTQLGDKLVGTGAVGTAIHGVGQGIAVSISSDGNTAIVGGYFDSSATGAAWIYTRVASNVSNLYGESTLQFGLEQNYPNPFNPTTTIRYTLPNRAHVLLTVFNTLGQSVATLVKETQDPGYHDVRFDGGGLASGVYFYRLRAGDFVQTKRLVILK